jgi:myo-inositol 2-dehydrogenase / D-chiro-inositol 1-dehydrogenase
MPDPSSRRQFVKASTLAGAALAAASVPRMVHAAGSDELRIGLVGCGGRGLGAAENTIAGDPNVYITALADLFPDTVEAGHKLLHDRLGDRLRATPATCFSGFDAYQKLIDSGVDVVLLCTPPHFRPMHLKYAIDAGKHVFCEKPVAVDAPGLRSVLETVRKAKETNRTIVSGLCWRYDYGVRETMARVLGGDIGEIVAIQENYLAGTLWNRPRKPNWTDMEYQLRNWLYYTWLSGDHNVEQHVHSLDKALWLNGDEPPVSCFGLGGRQVRVQEEFGNIFDHHAVCYEWKSGVKCFAYTRQMRGTYGDTEDYVLGTKGRAKILKHEIVGKDGQRLWRYDGPKPSMYDVEHKEMYEALRAGKTINNGLYMCYSTMMAIMGRMACYTGQQVSWEEAINSTEDLSPAKYEFGPAPKVEIAVPGVTPLV